jgi:hypothetical protein
MAWTQSSKYLELIKTSLSEDLARISESCIESYIQQNVVIRRNLLDIIDSSYILKSNYKIKYCKITGISVPRDFEVHHIDLDRSNNHISNLVALPIDIHRKYHAERVKIVMISQFERENNLIINVDLKEYGSSNAEIADIINEFSDIQNKASFWVGYRNALLGVNSGWPVYNYKRD